MLARAGRRTIVIMTVLEGCEVGDGLVRSVSNFHF